MRVTPTALPEVILVEPDVYADARGYFLESWSADRYAAAGVPGPFVQDNVSVSHRGVLRGLHLQHPRGQGKLVSVLSGEVFDVAVDVRRGSPTFGRWAGVALSGENRRQLYIPPGFAHGFLVVSAAATVTYKCTEPYARANELSVLWNDPDLGIEWPGLAAPVTSEKDAVAPRLRDVPDDRLPRVG